MLAGEVPGYTVEINIFGIFISGKLSFGILLYANTPSRVIRMVATKILVLLSINRCLPGRQWI
jgi:hypothetical protein